MIAHKHIEKIVAALTAVTLCLCLCAMAFSGTLRAAASESGLSMEYEEKLFSTDEPISVNILMDSEKWEEMLQNAIKEEYYQCDVEINGQTFYRVGIRPKGNTSLTSIANDPDTDRYSFKLEFDKYVDGQTCWGLDKLVLNNDYADATNMKEALIYDMYRYLGADASLSHYASISVNGDYWGVYLALEAVEDSFLLRNYGAESGELYKPEGEAPEDFTPGQNGGQMLGGTMGASGGADLNYTDDDLDSYSTIWEGEVTNTSESDHKQVVKALKNIAAGENLENSMDIDNLLRYMAVHAFSVNQDSLSGSMAHNYYLYEHSGQLNLFPWDYNLAFGGMGMGNNSATSVINDAIDTPFDSTQFFDALLENEEYRNQYHAYLSKLVEGYVFGGELENFYERTRAQLDSLVETDPTAFFTYDEYDTAAETLLEVVRLRGQSIRGQLDGTIPSTDQGQHQDSASLIDAGDIDLSVMGTMNQNDRGQPDFTEENIAEDADAASEPAETNAPESGENQQKSQLDQNRTFGRGRRMGQGFGGPGGELPTGQEGVSSMEGIITYLICFVILAAALLFAKFYRRKSIRR